MHNKSHQLIYFLIHIEENHINKLQHEVGQSSFQKLTFFLKKFCNLEEIFELFLNFWLSILITDFKSYLFK